MRVRTSVMRTSKLVVLGVFSIVASTALNMSPHWAANATPSSAALVAHWSFDQSSGTVLTDHSGNGYNGTLMNSPTWVAGRLGQALSFSNSRYVSVGNIPAINGVNKLTMSAWIKRGSSNAKVLIGKQTTNHDVAIEAWNDSNVYFQISNGTDASGRIALNDTTWHHVAFTFDGSQVGNSSRLKGYIDGVPRTLTFTGTIPSTTTSNTTPFNIGKIQSAYSNGQVDDLWIYNRVLTSAEIADLASATADMTAPNAPSGLTAMAPTYSQVNLSWTASTDNVGVTGYRIYRNNSQIGTSTTASYQNSGLAGSTTYSYTVAAFDAAGNVSAQSAAATVTTPAQPMPPTVSLTSDPTSVNAGEAALLQWSSTHAATCAAGGGWAGARALSGTEVLTNIHVTTTYSLTCSGAGGQASSSATVTVFDSEAPSGVSGLVASATSATKIDLTWAASTDNVAVTGYSVARDGSQVATVTGTSYQDTGLDPSTTYTYSVSAYDAAGNAGVESASESATTLPAPTGSALPIRISADRRRFEDSTGSPFLMHGDAAWSLIAQLNQADATTYLNDRQAKGFNTLLVNLLEHEFATNAPNNIYNVRPFTTPGDYSTPNEDYFANADWVIEQAEQRGMVVLLTPSYAGYAGGSQGWYQEMVANGATKLRNYGRYLGQRYGGYTNIIWVQAGDYNPPNRSLVDAIAQGILETDPDALQTAHGARETVVANYWSGYSWMAINQVYTRSEFYSRSLAQYQRNPVMPFIMVEGNYENEQGASTTTLRAQAYHSLLAGAGGHIFGNHPMWHFDGPGVSGSSFAWEQELSSPGAVSMKFLGDLFNSRPWYQLVPDSAHTTLTAGYGSSSSVAAAARTVDGGTVIIYTPVRKALTINMTRISGTQSNAWWFKPSTGVATSIGSFANTGSRVFTPPSTGDWVLVLDDAALGHAAPGQ